MRFKLLLFTLLCTLAVALPAQGVVNNADANKMFRSKQGAVIRSTGKSLKVINVTKVRADVPDNYSQITINVLDTEDPGTGVWGDGTGYQMLLDADHNTYGTIIPETGGLTTSGDASAATYAEFEYKIPENADGSLTTTNMIISGSESLTIPAGIYDWCITNPTPDDRMWIASQNGDVQGRYDDYEFESGFAYTFTISLFGSNDYLEIGITSNYENPTNLMASDIANHVATLAWSPGGDETSWKVEYKKKEDYVWTTAGTTTSTNFQLEGLLAGTEYQARVQGIYADGLSGWALVTFTTTNEVEPLCEPEDMGEISYTLTDSYGDGWNDCAINIVDAETGTVITSLTITSGSSLEGTVKLCYGRTVNFEWVLGSYASECSFTITDPDGNDIYNATTGSSLTDGAVFATYTMAMGVTPANLAINEITDHSAKATWNSTADSFNLRYRPYVSTARSWDFSTEAQFNEFTCVDSDGDGRNWYFNSSEGHNANGCASSASWLSGQGAFDPDNWFVSPEVTLNGTLSFWATSSSSYLPDKIAVYAVVGDGTNLEDYVKIGGDYTPTSWTEYTFDLSQFNGQQGHFAIRHYDCRDNYHILVDNITLDIGGAPEWVTVNNVTSPYTIEGLDPETEYEVQVQGVVDSETTTNWTESVLFTTLEAPAEMTLAELCQNGTPGKLYKISNEYGLLGVYKNGKSVWFKDEDQAVDYQNPTPTTGTYQYYNVVETTLGINKSEKDFAQNNWIEVVFPSEVNYTNAHVSNLTGTYSCENGNPKLVVSAPVESDDVNQHQPSELIYELNPYMAVNFVGNQTYTNNGESQTFFFSMPKAQEYAQILWAVYKGNNEFEMPTGDDNYYGFEGSFTINLGLNNTPEPSLVPKSTYNFKAIIRKSASKAGPYEVYPTDLQGIPTAINGVFSDVNGEVVGVEYVNSLGVVSKRPFSGINIVVTRYSDGSATTVKKVFK